MNNSKAVSDLCFKTLLCPKEKTDLEIKGGRRGRLGLKAFKLMTKVSSKDILYASFSNELFLVPFCVLADHEQKTIVIAVRGAFSIKLVLFF